MNLWIPVGILWVICGVLCLLVAGVIYKRGQVQSFLLGPVFDPFAMLLVGAFGVLGLIGVGKGILTLIH